MKTGIIRRIDELGRIVIPKEIRRKLDIQEGDPLEISLDGNKICFELFVPADNFEKSIKRLIERIRQDEYLNTDTSKVIAALKEAYNALRSRESEVEGE